MKVLLDTHSWAWVFSNNRKQLSEAALAAVADADAVCVSPASIFEIGQKVRLGKWPDMEAHLHRLEDIFVERGGAFAPLSPAVCLIASLLEWDHRDPFDRLIAATAIENGLTLVSADTQFDRITSHKGWMGRVW